MNEPREFKYPIGLPPGLISPPASKHDGKLDEYSYVKIDEYPSVEIASRGDEETALSYYETVHLTPRQALSLLVWLRQEEPELMRLLLETQRGE